MWVQEWRLHRSMGSTHIPQEPELLEHTKAPAAHTHLPTPLPEQHQWPRMYTKNTGAQKRKRCFMHSSSAKSVPPSQSWPECMQCTDHRRMPAGQGSVRLRALGWVQLGQRGELKAGSGGGSALMQQRVPQPSPCCCGTPGHHPGESPTLGGGWGGVCALVALLNHSP